MAFEQTREQLKEQAAELLAKIQESSAFNSVREQFESQTPAAQKLLAVGGFLLVGLIVLMIPMGYIFTSQDNLEIFDENQRLITGLLKASKTSKEPSPLPSPIPNEMFRSRVETILRDARLVPDQIGEIQPMPGDRPAKDLAPKVVQQSGLAVTVKKLNLSQIVSIGHQLQGMGAGTKMMGMDVTQSAGQDHYYDVVYRLIQFSLPVAAQDESPSGGMKSRVKPPPRPSADEEELGE
jgi:hypothetical protein